MIPNLNTDTTVLHLQEPKATPRRKLLTPLGDDEYLLVLDNSAMETFTTCPRYAWHYLVVGREAHARNAALVFGSACHVGWESIENGDTFEITAQKVIKFWTENPVPADDYRTLDVCLELLVHYVERKRLPDYHWEVLTDSSGPLVERAFELPLGVFDIEATLNLPEGPLYVKRIHVAWSGRMDVIVNVNGSNRVADNKTTSIAGDNFVQEFQLANQTIGYVWAAQKLWPSLNVNGFCLNAAHLKRPTAGTPLMSKGPRGGAPALNFFRAYFDYSPERLAQWKENAFTLVEDFIICLVRDGFPMHTKWCMGKYGRCQYFDVCTMDDPNVRMNMLTSDMFKSVTWNPTANR